MVLAANELHGSQGAQEKHRGDAEGVNRKPAHREDRVIAWRGGGGSLGHDLLQAQVELALALVALAHNRSLAFLGLEIGIRTGRFALTSATTTQR